MKHQGFTLIELMIVIAIVGMIASIAIPAFEEYSSNQPQQAQPVKPSRGCVEVVIIKLYSSNAGYNRDWAMVEDVNTKERFPILGHFGEVGDMVVVDRGKFEGEFDVSGK